MQTQLHNRLKRASGQLEKLRTSIDNGTDCTEVIPQFLAVRGALTAAFAEYVKESATSCADTDRDKLETLLTLLAKQ